MTVLTGRSLASNPTTTGGAISQTQTVSGRNLVSLTTITRGTIEQGSVPEIFGRDLISFPTVGRDAIRQRRTLVGRNLISLPGVTTPGQAGLIGALAATPEDRSLRHAVEPTGLAADVVLATLSGAVTSAPLRAVVQ